MSYWRGNGKAIREWAAHWHVTLTVIGLQHELLWLAHRTTTVKCRKGHVRHATASEQMPLGPMLGALRAPLVPPDRDMHVFEDVFMDLHATPSKRSRGTLNSTQPSVFTSSNEFAQRAQTASVPFPRTLKPLVLPPGTPFQPVPHGNVGTRDPNIASQRRSCAFDASISRFYRRRKGARDATCGKFVSC